MSKYAIALMVVRRKAITSLINKQGDIIENWIIFGLSHFYGGVFLS
ncbi:MAG: hypothetical protein J7K77_03340 [Dehalococcoidales bacterium]|nr:hypothetical protein [Dehalococcoidales bacterium]